MTARKFSNVAVLKGGPSSERDVSLKSGEAVAQALRTRGYSVTELDPRDRQINLPAGIDAVFIALHGEFGEDGQAQAMLDRMRIPYTGAGALASRMAMDKEATKRALLQAHIPTAHSQVLTPSNSKLELELPVVVKPVCQGSSIGITRVFTQDEWQPAVEEAFRYDKRVLVESFVAGRELTVGILDGQPLPIIEIAVRDGWYNYRTKYTKGSTVYHVPADLPEPVAALCREAAVATFRALACRGMGRVDILLRPDNTPCVLELNTIPGFTETSLLPKAAAAAGILFPDLCERIMETATHD